MFRAFAWDFGGQVVQQVVTFGLGILLARMLGPEAYGLVAMAMVFIAYTNIFSDLGLTAALIQRKSPAPIHYSSAFILNLAISCLFLVLTLVMAPLVAGFFRAPELTAIVRVLSVNFVLSSFAVVQSAYLRKQLDFKTLRVCGFIASVVSGVVGVIMAAAGFGVWSLVWHSVLGNLILSILLWSASPWRPSLEFRLSALRDLWSFGFNIFLSGLLEKLAQRIDELVIGRIFDAALLGLYAKAKHLNRFITLYSSHTIGSVTFPALASIQDDPARLRRATQRMIDVITMVSLAVTGALFLAAEPLIVLLLTETWRGAVPLFELLCWSGMFYPINAAQLSILRAQGRSTLLLRLELVKKAIYFTSIAIGFSFGMKGFLVALAVQSVIGTTINLRYTGEALGLPFWAQVMRTLRPIAAMVAAVVAAALLPGALGAGGMIPSSLLSLAVFGAVYLLLARILAPWAFQEVSTALRSALVMATAGGMPRRPAAKRADQGEDLIHSDPDGL